MGPSGLRQVDAAALLAGLDRPTSGRRCYLGDTEITSLSDKTLTLLRRDRIGFIFQSFNLLPTLTAAENIALPMRIAGRKPDQHWVASIVETVGLERPARPPPVASSPAASSSAWPRPGPWPAGREIVFADEPTGALDSKSGTELLAFLRRRWTTSARPSSWSPTTRTPPATPTGSSSSPTATSSTRCTARPPSASSTT